MSVSIDDLVSSLSASHVSQEAMDIATLQVFTLFLSPPLPSIAHPNNPTKTPFQSQLANVIYYPSQGQPGVHCVTRRNSLAQPCNPPTPTSATATFHFEWDDAARYRGQNYTPSYVPSAPPVRNCDVDDEMDDEQVEDLLNAHTPNQLQSVTPPHRQQQQQQSQKLRPPTVHQQQHHHHQHQQSFSPTLSPPPLGSPTMQMMYDATPVQSATSHFANTDPFYLAALQASSPSSSSSPFAPTPPSFFAQAARPAPNSPFNLAQQGHHTLELESRTVLVGAGQSR